MTASSQISAPEFLKFKGVINARDLGQYTTADGRRIAEGRLIRAAHLADATSQDIQKLSSMNITRILDFRTADEMPGKTDKDIPGAQYVNIPVDASGNLLAQTSEEEKKKFTKKKFDVKKIIVMLAFDKKAKVVAREMYPTLAFFPDCQKQYAEFFRQILATPEGCIIYHCTQGKDRTGFASALLLAALGADRATIEADFDATNLVYAADVRKYSRRVRFWGGKEEEIAVVKACLGANTENFIKTLDRIEKEYGCLLDYLKGPIGLSEQDIQTLRERYLGDSL